MKHYHRPRLAHREVLTECAETLDYIKVNLPDGCCCTTDRDGAPVECTMCQCHGMMDEAIDWIRGLA